MVKKLKKNTKRGAALDDRMEKAKRLFLEKMGHISDVQMSKHIGVHRNTIKSWKTKGNWEALVADIQHKADTKVTERTSDELADQAGIVFKEVFATARLLALTARRKVLVTDEKGRPMKDVTGQPMTNEDKLSASDIRSLMNALEIGQRITRLQLGQSTENKNSHISGEVTTTSKTDAQFGKAMDKIIETGDSEGQEALAALVQAQQKVIEKGGE